jgi:hypothetical protein
LVESVLRGRSGDGKHCVESRSRETIWGRRQQRTSELGASGVGGASAEKKTALSEGEWQESAGSLLLLAAAEETGLLRQLTEALATEVTTIGRLRQPHQLLSTLLFLGVVGLQRPWDLRGYSGDGLALLSQRRRAYGYEYTERFLSRLAQADGGQKLTNAITRWGYHLWKGSATGIYYLDMHRKPVYSDACLPRGLIGATGKILGCRAVGLMHDEQGHPLVATTRRGDTHLTLAVPELLNRHQQMTGSSDTPILVLDREGMGAAFLYHLQGHVITLLRSNQYQGEATFQQIGDFQPLKRDQAGQIVQEVASAQFVLKVPDLEETTLTLAVALIRDWSRPVPAVPTEDQERPPRDFAEPQWWETAYEAQPPPAPATEPKLIPIVSTRPVEDVMKLVTLYKQRWPAQENIIRDFLLPLGLDTNHGYAKQPIENSEFRKRREALEKQLVNRRLWKEKALTRSRRANNLAHRRWQKAKAWGEAHYRLLNRRQDELFDEGLKPYEIKPQIKTMKREIDSQLEEMWQAYYRAQQHGDQEWQKAKRYADTERRLLRQLEDLQTKARQMVELDNRKDHLMTSLRLALTNLIMWVRQQYFPQPYAQATWKRLAPFFRLPGQVVHAPDTCCVYLRPFNDAALNRDLTALCDKVNLASPLLPNGRRLLFKIQNQSVRISDMPP